MSGTVRIIGEIEGAEAAFEVAAVLDALAGAVAAFEIRPEEGESRTLWRVEAYPREPVLDAAAEIRLALAAAGAGGRRNHITEERMPGRCCLEVNSSEFSALRKCQVILHI